MKIKNKWVMIILLVIGILGLVVSLNDAQFYSEPILKITSITNGKAEKTQDYYGNVDQQTTQKVVGVIQNGKFKGQEFTITNTYSKSGAMDQKLSKGQSVFVNIASKNAKTATIRSYKRDFSVWILFWLAMAIVIVSLGRGGWLTLLSIVINTVLFIFAVILNTKIAGNQVVWLFGGLAIIFSLVTLIFVIGINRQMWLTFAAVIIATISAVLLFQLVITLNHAQGMRYETLEYATQEPQQLFIAQVMIGVLGAAMDMATDIISSLSSLKKERPDLDRKGVFQSGMQIGKSIMGPLINVLFFIFIAETLPMLLVFLKNGNSLAYSFEMNMTLGTASSLISAIGIVLTVIFASFFASRFLKGRVQNG